MCTEDSSSTVTLMYNVHTCTVIKADLKLEWVDSRPIVELEADRPLNK